MLIKSKLTEKDFINANFVLLYGKISTKIFTGILAFFLLISIFEAIFSPYSATTQIIISLAMLLIIPLKIYFTSKQNFNANKRSGETIEYQFDNIYLLMKGESFNSQSTWDKLHRVTRTKNWILLWQNSQIAHPIPRRDIRDEQLARLKELLQLHKVRNNL